MAPEMSGGGGADEAVASDASSTAAPISTELHCSRCGYLLFGLAPVGVCPECGLSIELSLRACLRGKDPRWLWRLEIGAWLIFIAAPIWVATWGFGQGGSIIPMEVAGLLPAALHVAAYWLVSTPEPALSRPSNDLPAQGAVRAFTFFYAVCVISRLFIALGRSSDEVMTLAYIITGWVCVGWTATSLIYFRHLARHLPAPRLAQAIRVLQMLPVLLALFLIVAIVNSVSKQSWEGEAAVMFVIGVPLGLCAIEWWVLIFLFALRVTKMRRDGTLG